MTNNVRTKTETRGAVIETDPMTDGVVLDSAESFRLTHPGSVPAPRLAQAGPAYGVSHGDAVAFLRTLATESVDLVVTDPPRGGMTPELVDAIGASRATSLVYVSCDPPAMARDMARLAAAGFVVSSWRLLDLFPRTAHIEAVVVATRSAR